eukprot:397403-Prymnesium_polylepis.1
MRPLLLAGSSGLMRSSVPLAIAPLPRHPRAMPCHAISPRCESAPSPPDTVPSDHAVGPPRSRPAAL